MSSDQRAARLELDIACRKIGAESPNSHSSSSGQTYYDILGVAQIAGQDAIKTAYRKLAKAHHPDLNALDPRAAEHFARINRAYRVLRDARRRDLYDARLHDARLRGAADATVSRRGRAWRILGMVAGYSMLASVATAGMRSLHKMKVPRLS